MSRFHTTLLLLSLVLVNGLSSEAADRLKVLIVDGQNNHGFWPKTTIMMKQYLEQSGRFTVDIARTKYLWQGNQFLKDFALDDGKKYERLPKPKPDPDFKPDFSKYDVVLSNFGWKAAPWPRETQQALEDFVSQGGGLVIIHAANNSFPKWPAYNEMIGLGGWGDRDETSGPYVYIDDSGKQVRDTSVGAGGNHGDIHEFQVIVRDQDHPITKGLPTSWMHSDDELYEKLRGPANNMNILATAFASPDFRGSDRHEPVLLTISYGDGRVFHSPLGHSDVSMECVAFITALLRGTEWAATGQVTLTEVPEDFPTPDKSSRRTFQN